MLACHSRLPRTFAVLRCQRIREGIAFFFLEASAQQRVDGALERDAAVVRVNDRAGRLHERFTEILDRIATAHHFFQVPQYLVHLAELDDQAIELLRGRDARVAYGTQRGELRANAL